MILLKLKSLYHTTAMLLEVKLHIKFMEKKQYHCKVVHWPMTETYSKIKFVSLDISTAPRLSDNLQFLNIL